MKTKLLTVLFFSILLVACDDTKDVNKNNIEPIKPISTLEIDNSAGISKYYKPESNTEIPNTNIQYDNETYNWNDNKFTVSGITYELGVTTLNNILNDNFKVSSHNLSVSSNGTNHSIINNNLDDNEYNLIELQHKDKFNQNIKYTVAVWKLDKNILNNTIDSIVIDASSNTKLLNNIPELSISSGVKLGFSAEKIKELYGEPNYSYNTDNRIVLNYETKNHDYNLILHVHYIDGLNKIEIYRGHYY